MSRKYLVIFLGGTPACDSGSNRKPEHALEELIDKHMPKTKEFMRRMEISLDCLELARVDSTNLSPLHALNTANCIVDRLAEYDGVAVVLGSDTTHYAAPYISFAIQNPDKPIAVTGSRDSALAPNNDFDRNFSGSLRYCVHVNNQNEIANGQSRIKVREVAGIYEGKIFRANRMVKINPRAYSLFVSPMFPVLGKIHNDETILNLWHVVSSKPIQADTIFEPYLNDKVAIVKVFPGMSPSMLYRYIDEGYEAFVLEGFADGHVPTEDNCVDRAECNGKRSFLPVIEKLAADGIPLVVTSENLYGIADMSRYEVGILAKNAGTIPAYDMRTPSAFAKLMWALGKSYHERKARDLNLVRMLMLTNVAGEISPELIIGEKPKYFDELGLSYD